MRISLQSTLLVLTLAPLATMAQAPSSNGYPDQVVSGAPRYDVSYSVEQDGQVLSAGHKVVQAWKASGQDGTNAREYVKSISVDTLPRQFDPAGLVTRVFGPAQNRTSEKGIVRTGLEWNTKIVPRDGAKLQMVSSLSYAQLLGAQDGFNAFTTPDGEDSIQLPYMSTASANQTVEIMPGVKTLLVSTQAIQAAAGAGSTRAQPIQVYATVTPAS
jgi:hypothetical protein